MRKLSENSIQNLVGKVKKLTIMNVKELLKKMIFANDSDTYGIIPPTSTIPVKTDAPNKSM